MIKKVVIFDLDGTLLNTLQDLTDSTNYALSVLNFPSHSIDKIRSFVGNGVSKLIELSIPNGLENENYEKCLEIFKKHYSQNMYNKTKPYDGIIEMLVELKKLGFKTAVVSNKFDYAVKKLCKKYFHNLTDMCVGENEKNGIKKKPSPEAVFSVVKAFGVNMQDCIYVGDSEVDIQTSKNAGIDFIGVSWGFKDKEFLKNNGAVNIIDYPLEIIKYL